MVETSKLAAVRACVLATAYARPEPVLVLGERPGRIKRTIMDVLKTAGCPLRVTDIREACEHALGAPVNRSTISDCLIKHSTGDRRLFDRTERGAYAWRAP